MSPLLFKGGFSVGDAVLIVVFVVVDLDRGVAMRWDTTGRLSDT